MKVFITADYEGVSGYVQWESGSEREAITADINAAIAGAIGGGASKVLAGESHGNMRNIIPEKLDPRASFLSGQPKPLNHVGGIDSTFDAAMLVAYHAKAGTWRGIMAHTYTFKVFSLKFNDIEIGEIGTDAAIAGCESPSLLTTVVSSTLHLKSSIESSSLFRYWSSSVCSSSHFCFVMAFWRNSKYVESS